MNIKNIVASLSFLIPFASFAQQGYTIHGKIANNLKQGTKIFLNYRNDTTEVLDSTILNKGNFMFKGHLPSPTQAWIIVQHNPNEPLYKEHDNFYFYLENSNISITSSDSLRNAVVKGSKTNDDYNELYNLQKPYRRSADSITKVYYSLTPQQRKDSSFVIPAREIMTATQEGYNSVTRNFIYTHLHSYISLTAFNEIELAYNFNPDTAATKFSKFPEEQRNSVMGKKIEDIIQKGRKTNVGIMAMDFTQNDTTGKAVKLSGFRGHYVLVDFWASWCARCRAENPNLLAAYRKYKDDNFTILGVSLDDEKSRKAWIYAVQKDSLPWTQVSELKGFESKAAIAYGITEIPSNFLIDPTGKIIARNLRGKELDKTLQILFTKK